MTPQSRPDRRSAASCRDGFRVVFILLLAAATGLPAGADTVAGRLKILEKGQDQSSREHRSAVVYYVPDAPVDVLPLDEPQSVVMVRKEFVPRILTVTRGTTVAFPNEDGILHNVFSLSGKNRFDLGLYRRGESADTKLDHPGIVQIFCNVHHSMVAYVLVLDTPFYATPEKDGSFRFDGVPAGPGELVVWHERAEPTRIRLQGPSLHLEPVVEIEKPKIPRHRNKFGKPYTRKRRGKAY